ncbi:MAG: kynureninase [Gemmatimonadetes bacterium]|nr:kynureninase [Gemmatimonadota bacterium]
MKPESLYASPNALAPHYSTFRVSERLLLTGHSHQAWPDVGFEGQKQAWLDAAEFVDRKWDAAASRWARVGEGFRGMMGGCSGDMTLDTNTHALLMRFLSALPLKSRPRIVTTDGEFHTIRRQADRLAEEGIEVVKVASEPVATVAERVATEIDDRTACALVSSVFFGTGLIVPGLPLVAAACAHHGAEMLIDAYHSLNVVPFSLDGMENAFVVGGGYKYCQLGEGNCVLRVPEGCEMRPIVTGWFSEFSELADAKNPGEVRYGTGQMRFAGSTFDPTSQYRGAAVLDFFEEQGLTPELLREVSQHQVGVLLDTFLGLDLDPRSAHVDADIPLLSRAGFLAVRAPGAERLSEALRAIGVSTDARGEMLRFGPAPYLTNAQLVEAMQALEEVARRPMKVE